MKTASISIRAWGDHAMALEASEEACFPCPWCEVWKIQSDFCNLHLSCRIFSSLVMIIFFLLVFLAIFCSVHLAFFGSRCLKSVVHERTLRRETENVPGETRYDNWTQQHPCPQMRGWHFHQGFQQKKSILQFSHFFLTFFVNIWLSVAMNQMKRNMGLYQSIITFVKRTSQIPWNRNERFGIGFCTKAHDWLWFGSTSYIPCYPIHFDQRSEAALLQRMCQARCWAQKTPTSSMKL